MTKLDRDLVYVNPPSQKTILMGGPVAPFPIRTLREEAVIFITGAMRKIPAVNPLSLFIFGKFTQLIQPLRDQEPAPGIDGILF